MRKRAKRPTAHHPRACSSVIPPSAFGLRIFRLTGHWSLVIRLCLRLSPLAFRPLPLRVHA
jgi:hypothetical protein